MDEKVSVRRRPSRPTWWCRVADLDAVLAASPASTSATSSWPGGEPAGAPGPVEQLAGHRQRRRLGGGALGGLGAELGGRGAALTAGARPRAARGAGCRRARLPARSSSPRAWDSLRVLGDLPRSLADTTSSPMRAVGPCHAAAGCCGCGLPLRAAAACRGRASSSIPLFFEPSRAALAPGNTSPRCPRAQRQPSPAPGSAADARARAGRRHGIVGHETYLERSPQNDPATSAVGIVESTRTSARGRRERHKPPRIPRAWDGALQEVAPAPRTTNDGNHASEPQHHRTFDPAARGLRPQRRTLWLGRE